MCRRNRSAWPHTASPLRNSVTAQPATCLAPHSAIQVVEAAEAEAKTTMAVTRETRAVAAEAMRVRAAVRLWA